MAGYARGLKSKTKQAIIPLARFLAKEPANLPIDLWGMDTDARGRLRFAGHDVLDLVAQHGETPVHLLDVARLEQNLAAFSESRAEVFYSFKTQPLPWIIKRLLARGAGAEVISEYELRLALHLGFPPEKIIFNGPGKSDASIRLAVESGIFLFNVNHLEEISRLERIARELGRKVRVAVRVTTSSGWSSQFGCSIASGEALLAFERVLQIPQFEVVGLHSHRGSHMYSAGELSAFVGELLSFADTLKERLGFEPEIIDFGGSLGIQTVRPFSNVDKRLVQTLLTAVGGPELEGRLDPRAYVRALVSQVESHFQERGRKVPRIAIEPGRALVGNPQALVARVMTTRETTTGITYAVLDAGVNIAGILGSELHQIYRVTNFAATQNGSSREGTRLYRLVGPICQPGDVIYHCVRLPVLTEGDVLLVMDSGAYFEPDSTSFSFRRPATVAIAGDTVETIRRGETFADMIHRDVY